MLDNMPVHGAQKAAILMLALGEESCSRLFEAMHEEEIREISSAMAQLGTISAETVEQVCNEFSGSLGNTEVLVGNIDSTERLLKRALPAERAAQIMEEIRGPAGRTMWDKLGNVSEVTLANYLKNEYPQTVAVILGKIKPLHAARVLSLLPEEFSMDVMTRMLRTENVQKAVLQSVENTLRSEFVSNLSRGAKRNSYEQMADIFNNFDRRLEGRFMTALEQRSQDDAERIKALMFTFEDLQHIPRESLSQLVGRINREVLPLALKGASEQLRVAFLGTMSERVGKMLSDEIASLGPVRVKDVDAAQAEIVQTAKEMADAGEIELQNQGASNELIL